MGAILYAKPFTKPGRRRRRASQKMSGKTGILGNSDAVSMITSTKWPLTALLADPSEEPRARRAALDLDWPPRDENQEADDLSNVKTMDFDESRRIRVEPEGL